MKYKNVSFDNSLRNILGSDNVIIKVVMLKRNSCPNYR
jgi:hypothetical protein